MKYQLDNQILDVKIIKKNNKNIYIRLKSDGIIYVTTNYFVSKKYIKRLLDDNQNFLRRSLLKINKQNEKEGKFLLLGCEYNITFINNFKKVEVDVNNGIIYCENQKQLELWLKKQIKLLYLQRLDYNYNLFNEKIPYPKLKVRNMKTRWGVCNRSNNTVTLNSKLIEYSIDKLDYVIVHELSHFVHFNHSALFWKEVEQYCPNYKKIRKELNDVCL